MGVIGVYVNVSEFFVYRLVGIYINKGGGGIGGCVKLYIIYIYFLMIYKV